MSEPGARSMKQINKNEDCTILLVDDIATNIDVLMASLKGKGYKIGVAKNGRTALKRAEFLVPDLILLDIMMPGMDGFETCQKLKENPVTRDIPVIFMSALTDTVDKLKGFEVGGVDYITKPYDTLEFLARIKLHLSVRTMQHKLETSNKQLKVARDDLQRLNSDLESLFENMPNGFAEHEIICDEKGKPYDYRFLSVNPGFEKQTGLTRDIIGKTVKEIIPGIQDIWIETYGEVALTGRSTSFEQFSEPLNTYFRVYAFSGRKGHFATLFDDITERKQIEKLMVIQRDLGAALGVTQGFVEALNLCLESALMVDDFDCGGVYLVDSQNGDLNLMAHKGLSPAFLKNVFHFDAKSPQARFIAEGKPSFQSVGESTNPFEVGEKRKPDTGKEGIRSIAVMPVMHEQKPIAVLNMASKKSGSIRGFARYSLQAIASQFSGALAKIKVDQALKASQRNLDSLFRSLDDFLFVLDASHNIVGYNPVVEKRLGYTSDELLGMNILSLHPPERTVETANIFREMVEKKANHCPIPLMTKAGDMIPVETKITMGTWDSGQAIFGISRDISERIEVQRARRLSEDRLLVAIEAIDEGFVLFDAGDCLVMFNTKYMEMYHGSADILIPGTPFEDILRHGVQQGQFAGAQGREEEWIAQRIAIHNSANSSFEQKLSNGTWLKVSERRTIDGSSVGFRVDITNIKRSEESTRNALKEKEVLLREIHHRVKNNMQVISSLLSLQANKIEDQNSLDAFTEAESRVLSMSFIHEILYQSDNLSEVRFQVYLENLTTHLLQVYTCQAGSVGVDINADEVILRTENAVPCGLIVTELFTNALKYAVPASSLLEIKIQVAHETDGNIVMTISDNGSAMPPDFDPQKTKTLGLRIVMELVSDQLEGTWKMERDQSQGVCWVITWPVG